MTAIMTLYYCKSFTFIQTRPTRSVNLLCIFKLFEYLKLCLQLDYIYSSILGRHIVFALSVRPFVRPSVCMFQIVYAPYREDWSKNFHETLVRCSPQQGNVQNECLDYTSWLNIFYILDFKLKKKKKHGKSYANGGDLPKKKSGTMRGKTDNHKGKPTAQSIDGIL